MREDYDLAFMLRYKNVAWYEEGSVKILDRRVYPTRLSFKVCKTHLEVAQAIRDMVTQSGGPYQAAAMGMALAAYESRELGQEARIQYLEKAAHSLAGARPTTSRKMMQITNKCYRVGREAILRGEPAQEKIFNYVVKLLDDKYRRIARRAEILVDFFPDKGTVMTQCFAEVIVGLMLRRAREVGKDISLICPETRPYFQGARLTASVARDQGFDVTVITDNMPGYVLKKKEVDLFTSAADVISLDGHVVNKIGTFQIALLCDYYNIPYLVTGNPDPDHESIDSVEIEERDGDFVLEAMGVRTAMEGVRGYYPAFDITPPKLVSGIITDRGFYSPYNLRDFK